LRRREREPSILSEERAPEHRLGPIPFEQIEINDILLLGCVLKRRKREPSILREERIPEPCVVNIYF
jgi:hypothetical protein